MRKILLTTLISLTFTAPVFAENQNLDKEFELIPSVVELSQNTQTLSKDVKKEDKFLYKKLSNDIKIKIKQLEPLTKFKYEHKLPYIYQNLGLSPIQEDAIFQLRYKNIPVLREKLKELKKYFFQLENSKYKENFNYEKAHELIAKISKIQTEIELNKFYNERDIYNVLTKEQQEKVQKSYNHKWQPIL